MLGSFQSIIAIIVSDHEMVVETLEIIDVYPENHAELVMGQ